MRLLNRTIPILAISLLVPLSAHADSWSCRLGNDVREVHMEQTTSAPLPCQVVYKKLTEGVEDQVLWTAQNDAAYCEFKAKGFIEKLESLGWTCVETIRDETAVQ
jgi:hypothetical protein